MAGTASSKYATPWPPIFGFMTASEYVGHPEDIGKGYRTLDITDLMKLMNIFEKRGIVDLAEGLEDSPGTPTIYH